jgi:hypothetical protein
VQIRGTSYPVLLPKLRDPRLHLAAVIVSLQALGQVAFEFRLSIAQILVSLITAAVLEVAIAFRRQHVIMWPASALLTGNGVAFVLRVPGTEHGDWWSMHGAWIFATTSAVALLSKYLVRFRGRHVFNPSNIGLVLCFLLLGPEHADPLDFWWGPMSLALALALVIIVAGGVAILRRLRLLEIAVGFWLAFAAGIGVVAASGHEMTARWHVGPVTDADFWVVLAFSPEILVFLFFMITDPKTIPASRIGRRSYAVSVGLLAALLIAPQTTEFASKVAVLGSLALVCAVRPLIEVLSSAGLPSQLAAIRVRASKPQRGAVAGTVLCSAVAIAGLLLLAGIPARSNAAAATPTAAFAQRMPEVTIEASQGVAQVDRRTALHIARDMLADIRVETEALRLRDAARAAVGADGTWLKVLQRTIRSAEGPLTVPTYNVERVRLSLKASHGQAPPIVTATITGTVQATANVEALANVGYRTAASGFKRTVQLISRDDRYVIVRSGDGDTLAASVASDDVDTTCHSAPRTAVPGAIASVAGCDVATRVGLRFHGSYGASTDAAVPASLIDVSRNMQLNNGNGAAVGDYNGDGFLDVYLLGQRGRGNRLYRNDRRETSSTPRHSKTRADLSGHRRLTRRFTDVTDLAGVGDRGMARAAQFADFDGDDKLDLVVVNDYIPGQGMSPSRIYRNRGDGTFADVTARSGFAPVGMIVGGLSVVDYDNDGLLDIYISYWVLDVRTQVFGYGSARPGFPGVNSLYRNLGGFRFENVTASAGLEHTSNSFTSVFADFDADGLLDLFLARDSGGPDLLYKNVDGKHFRDVSHSAGAAHRGSDMGVAVGDANSDGLLDLYVTNITDPQRQIGYHPHNALLVNTGRTQSVRFRDEAVPRKVDDTGWGWGAAFADVNLDGNTDIYAVQGMRSVVCPSNPALCDAKSVLFLSDGRDGFVRVAGAGFDRRGDQRSLVVFDYNRDGAPDFLITQVNGRVQLMENRTKSEHWLTVAPRPGKRRTVQGAVVAVTAGGRTNTQVILGGGSYLAGPPGEAYFGLGDARYAEKVAVSWPGGKRTTLRGVEADQVVVVVPDP